MVGCINKSLPEYQSLKNRSGIQEEVLDAYCAYYIDNFQRFPHLDELPEADSRSALKEALNIREGGFTTTKEVTEVFGEGTTQEINSKINDQYSDLETRIIPLNDGVIVRSEQRPSEYRTAKDVESAPWEDVGNVKDPLVFQNAIDKLSNIYGIPMHATTTQEIQNGPMKNIILDNPSSVRAFIYNGEIYINLDTASIDAPIHELLHLFIGSLRFKNQDLYMQLLQTVQQLPDFMAYFNSYKNRTESDVLEEIFVSEFSKRLVGMESAFDNMSKVQMNEFLYHLNRTLDSVLMGEFSVKSIPAEKIPQLTLRELARKVHSTILQSMSPCSLNEAAQHRCYQNVKSELMKKRELKQECV